MSIPGAASPLFLGAAVAEEAAFQIDRSLRFNDDDSAHLSKTFSSAGNRRTWTWSAWVKVCSTGTGGFSLFGASGANTGSPWNFATTIRLRNNKISFCNHANDVYLTDAVFRDNSAWYHIVVALDTTDSTTANRVKIYVNGELQDKTHQGHGGAAEPTQNLEYAINTTDPHKLGATSDTSGTAVYFWDGYIADVHFIDGQALDPTDFGEYDDNNVWQPKAYAGSYGTNGFHLDFSDASSNAALGNDSSGNNNDWTVNNLVAGDTWWDQYLSTNTSFTNSRSNAFNGIIGGAGFSSDWGTRSSGASTITFSGVSISVSSSLVIYVYGDNTNEVSASDFQLNGSSASMTIQKVSGVTDSGIRKCTFSASYPITLSSLSYSNPDSGKSTMITAIEVDGDLLISSQVSDSLIDTPTNYEASSGNNGGNYATLNPLSKGSAITLANGNLDISAASSGSQRVWGTIGVSTGKWYFEFTQSSGTYAQAVGIKSSAAQDNSTQYGYHGNTGNKIDASGSTSSYGATWGNNDIIGVAFDLDAGTITFYKNGVSQGQAFSGITDATYFPYVFGWSGGAWGGFVNFGQRPFAYTPPTGFLPLVTTSLSDPTIADGSTAMDVALYTGNGSTQSITGFGFSPDLVWVKSRNQAYNHYLWDIIRGAGESLFSNTTDAETTQTNTLTSFDSNGFSLDSRTGVNSLNNTFVGWAWDAGTTTATNTDGSITSNVRANQSAGFSIVSYTGTGANASIGHGLNAAPEMIITKNRASATNWRVYHGALGNTKTLFLSTSGAADTSAVYWNNTSPTSTVFSVGSDDGINGNGNAMIAYCFAPVSQYSAFGSYVGTGTSVSTAPFVYTGFKPAFLLLKLATGGSARWFIFDSTRDTDNENTASLYPDRSDAEGSSHPIDFLSNGFKIRESDSAGYTNYSGSTYVWAAFAESPFKTSRAV